MINRSIIEKPGHAKSTVPNVPISPQIAATKEEWLHPSRPIITVPNVLLLETPSTTSSSLKMKLSDGVNAYDKLPYLVGDALSDEYAKLLANVNEPGGLLKLNDNGIIPARLLPPKALNTNYSPRFYKVPDYESMLKACAIESLKATMECSIIVVADATGDPQNKISSKLNPVWYRIDLNEVVPEIELVLDLNSIVVPMSSLKDDTDSPTGGATDKYLKFSYADKKLLEQGIAENTVLIGTQINAATLAEILT